MNKRIKELSDQAWKYASDNASDDQHGLVYTETLSKLIIQECMTLSDEAMQSNMWPSFVLKRHFGVSLNS